MRNLRWLLLCVLVPLVLQGCAMAVSHPRAMQPMRDFAPLPEDVRVWIEPGAEDYGRRVSQKLDEAIFRVEAPTICRSSKLPGSMFAARASSCWWTLWSNTDSAI